MNNLRKGVICATAGVATTLAGFGYIASTRHEIDPAGIEACAQALPYANPNSEWLPNPCYDSRTASVFDTKEVTYKVVTDSAGGLETGTTQKPILLSPEEYRHRAYELKAAQESTLKVILQGLGAVGLGVIVGGVGYWESAVNTPEYRIAKQQGKAATTAGQTIFIDPRYRKATD